MNTIVIACPGCGEEVWQLEREAVLVERVTFCDTPDDSGMTWNIEDQLDEVSSKILRFVCSNCGWKSEGGFDVFVQKATMPDVSKLLELRDRMTS